MDRVIEAQALIFGPQNSTWQGNLLLLCKSGAVYILDELRMEWELLVPAPEIPEAHVGETFPAHFQWDDVDFPPPPSYYERETRDEE